MKTRCDRFYGLGPLFDDPPGPPTGDPAPGAPPSTPPAQPAGGGGAPPAEQTVPYARFQEVNDEYQRLKKAEDERQAKELSDKGEHEKVAAQERAKREAAEAQALAIGRKAAFVAGASGKVSDVNAAYKLAAADGDLAKVELDDAGEPKDPKVVEGIVAELVKRYVFLKPGTSTSDFGAPANGNGSPDGPQPKTSREMLSAGYAALGDPRRRREG